ncbi:hypothetical protein HHK36_000148 [Tetracentron sinense]|uniref:WRKY domain-containing protein n=1 Tax=Tetracentron sinense TaxID=13715 RepID=A0A835DQL7_TETSI|nr:hypothetical protein HHK36_000148 [Tetracentron sinense]
MNNNWDLQAVVRGFTATATATIDDPLSCFVPSSGHQDDCLFFFPDLFETRTVLEELEDLYKPFLPNSQPLSSLPSFPISSLSALGGFKEKQQKNRSLSGSASPASTNTHSQTPRSKKRKNQQKKVVCQVPAEGLSSDMWAWRKYGQKPIKGSPYPRGYYKCSSSKGCLARKQVERSHSDPAMFIITYTAEHNHSLPTPRNSVAVSSRHKFSTPQQATTGDPDTPTSKFSFDSSPISTMDLSPTTTLMVSIEDELLLQPKQKSREDKEEGIVTTDELFMGLEEFEGPISTHSAFDGCFSDHFETTFPPPWFSNTPTTPQLPPAVVDSPENTHPTRDT